VRGTNTPRESKQGLTPAAHLRRPHADVASCPNPTAAVVKCSRLFGGVLQLRGFTATGMPQCDDLNGTGRGLDEPIVQVVVDTTQENPAHTREANVAGSRPRVWLRGHKLQRSGKFLVQSARRLCPIVVPPPPGLVDVPCRTASEAHGEAWDHARFRSARRTSSAGTVSPRSASASDSRSSASAAGSSVNVSSPSRVRTVTTVPSGNGSPSTMIFPATTLPDVITMLRF